MKSITSSLKELAILSVALTFALVANFAYGQWTDAPASPPNSNVEAPINVSANQQTKFGMLTAPIFRAADQMRSDSYCDYDGNNCFSPTDVGSGGGGNCTTESQQVSGCAYPSGDMSNAVSCPAGWIPSGPSTTNGSSCSTNNLTYTRTCIRTVCEDTSNNDNGNSGGQDEVVFLGSPNTVITTNANGDTSQTTVDLSSYASNITDVLVETTGGSCSTTNGSKTTGGQARTSGAPNSAWGGSGWHATNQGRIDVRTTRSGSSGCLILGNATRVDVVGYRCNGECT